MRDFVTPENTTLEGKFVCVWSAIPPVWALDGWNCICGTFNACARQANTDCTIFIIFYNISIYYLEGLRSGGDGECISGNTKLEKEYFRTYPCKIRYVGCSSAITNC